MSQLLTPRWTLLRPHTTQQSYWNSPHRFNMVPAGRRSGKTELAKRKLVKRAIKGTAFPNARFFAGAPTRDQAKAIYWDDLKKLVPQSIWAKQPSETDLDIFLINGSQIRVVGMDKPQRIEGAPWDGGILDEYANMKPEAWGGNVRPALADRNGWCDLIGVPEGHNHYYEAYLKATSSMEQFGAASEWGVYHWFSSDILPAAEVEAARRDLDPRMFAQEYEAQFVSWAGQALFDIGRMLIDGKPVEWPAHCDGVYCVIDTAMKAGSANDGTAVTFFASSEHTGHRLVVLDWDYVKIEGNTLAAWLPSILARLEELARLCGARAGALGCWIEDANAGSILIQHAQSQMLDPNWIHKGIRWDLVKPISTDLVSKGKDGRAFAVSSHHYSGKVRLSRPANDRVTIFNGISRNHLTWQIQDFRVGDKDAAKRSDDLLDTYTYGLALALGNAEGY